VKKNTDKEKKESLNVEFGMEFGDVNASKLFEIPFMNEEKTDKNKKKC
jgi:hypothetical protein